MESGSSRSAVFSHFSGIPNSEHDHNLHIHFYHSTRPDFSVTYLCFMKINILVHICFALQYNSS